LKKKLLFFHILKNKKKNKNKKYLV